MRGCDSSTCMAFCKTASRVACCSLSESLFIFLQFCVMAMHVVIVLICFISHLVLNECFQSFGGPQVTKLSEIDHCSAPTTVVPPHAYGRTCIPASYNAEDAQAVLPAPPLQTQKQATPCPPQLPYVAALPVSALRPLLLLHADRTQHSDTNALLQHTDPKDIGH